MIHVERTLPPPPTLLPNEPARRELEKLHALIDAGELSRQRRFDFKVYRHPSVREALTQLFHGKCAYCEAKVSVTQPVDVEFFRPKAGVLERPEHPGYWWLAMVWENMLASCADCNRIRTHEGIRTGKANRFPLVDEAERAFKPGEETRERPLLLDPCRDFPEEHLVFDQSGHVASDTERGHTTIAVLGLNRPALVNARRIAAEEIKYRFELLNQLPEGEARLLQLEDIQRMTEPQSEFAAMKRQVIASLMEQYKGLMAEKEPEIAQATKKVSKARQRRAKKEHSAFEVAQSKYSLADEKGREIFRSQRRLIERIEIEDVKAIEKLELDLKSASGRTPWLMLLGENGTGKSTVLQTTALALLGAEAFVNLAKNHGIHPKDFVRFGCDQGSVSVKLSGFPKPHKLVFHPDKADFTSPTDETTSILFKKSRTTVKGSGWDPQTLLLGYGATKLLPRGSAASADGDQPVEEFSRVDNLFDPFVALIHAEKWLLSLEPKRFRETALILKDLMALTEDADLEPEKDKIVRTRQSRAAVSA